MQDLVINPLDPMFVAAKPRHSMDEKERKALFDSGRGINMRKRDGYRHFASLSNGMRLYNRGIVDVTASYPHIRKELLTMPLPKGPCLFDGELIVDRNGADDFIHLTKIAKLKPAESIKAQMEHGYASFMMFDVIMWDGELVCELPFLKRWELMLELFFTHKYATGQLPKYILEPPTLSCSPDKAIELVQKRNWEGLVTYDLQGTSTFKLDGRQDQPPRPKGIAKWKPIFEDDFIATHFSYGSGKNQFRMGKLHLSQIHPKTGEHVSCGECGGGFSDEDRNWFTTATFPIPVQISFYLRFPSGALRHPNFMRVRDDKKIDECIAHHLA